MEWVFLIGGLLVVAAVVFMNWVIKTAREHQQSNPQAFLDQWFDGREQVIVTQDQNTLSEDAILAGANERGYRLVSASQLPYPRAGSQKMIFEKRS